MLLHFISDPVVGTKERRLIRSHVMKGKNAGKTRPPRKSLKHRNLGLSVPDSNLKVEQHECEMTYVTCPHQPLWNELSLSSYPYYIGPEKETFVYQRLWIIAKALYPPEFCTEVNLSQYAWFRYVLEDTAYFHTLLAICFSFKTHFGGPRHISPSALRHVSQAYRMTNERLSSSDACSDQAIAVVTMLAIYQRMHHQQAIGLVHFQGLRRMVELRGGLAKLSSENRALAQKPWRLALEFAIQDGAPMTFDLADVKCSKSSTGFSFPTFALEGSDEEFDGMDVRQPPGYSCGLANVDPPLLSLLSSITCFTTFLNKITAVEMTKLNPLDYSDAVCILLHRLLAYAPLDPQHRKHLPPMDNLVHLTLVAVMTRLLPEYGHDQAQYNLLESQLRRALQIIDAPRTTAEYEMMLWSTFVADATILTNVGDEMVLMKTAESYLTVLYLHDWADVRSVLCRFAWISVFYDRDGLRFFRQAKEQNGANDPGANA